MRRTLAVRRLTVPLRTVHASGDDWRAAFQAPLDHAPLALSEDLFRAAEDAIGLRFHGHAINVRDYLDGDFLDDTEAPSSSFGVVGELLTWLHYVSLGAEVLRVDGTTGPEPGDRQRQRPDFYIREDHPYEGQQTRVVEAKSGDLLKLLQLLGDESVSRPCSNMRSSAVDALAQLGFAPDLVYSPGGYHLTLRGDHAPVPFPADNATAAVCLFRDGRLDRYQGLVSELVGVGRCARPETRVHHRQPWRRRPDPRPRHCHQCLGHQVDPAEVHLGIFDNAPDFVPLLRDDSRGADSFFEKYRRWQRACWVRRPDKASAAARDLVEHIERLFMMTDEAQPDLRALRDWWVRHLGALTPLPVNPRDFDIPTFFDGSDDAPLRVGRWRAERDSLEELQQRGGSVHLAGEVPEYLDEEFEEFAGTPVYIGIERSRLDLRMDLAAIGMETLCQAESDAAYVASLALSLALWIADRRPVRHQRVRAVRGFPPADPELPEGAEREGPVVAWRLLSTLDPGYRRWSAVSQQPYWYRALRLGHPEASLNVLPDGRLRLRAPLHPRG